MDGEIGTPINGINLLTYTGLSMVVVALIGGLKKMWGEWVKGKEPHLGLALSLVLGIAAKLTIPGAYENVHWLVHLVSLLFVALGAKLGHDWLVNEVITNKAEDKKKGA